MVDDNSPDNTQSIVKSLMEQNENIHLLDLKLDLEMHSEDFNMQFKPSKRISFFKWILMDNMIVLLYLPFWKG